MDKANKVKEAITGLLLIIVPIVIIAGVIHYLSSSQQIKNERVLKIGERTMAIYTHNSGGRFNGCPVYEFLVNGKNYSIAISSTIRYKLYQYPKTKPVPALISYDPSDPSKNTVVCNTYFEFEGHKIIWEEGDRGILIKAFPVDNN